jgi:hypothetical protein
VVKFRGRQRCSTKPHCYPAPCPAHAAICAPQRVSRPAVQAGVRGNTDDTGIDQHRR